MKQLVLGVLMGIGLVGCNAAPPTELTMENLLRMPLTAEFIADREIVVSYVQIPPNTTMDHTADKPVRYLETGGVAEE